MSFSSRGPESGPHGPGESARQQAARQEIVRQAEAKVAAAKRAAAAAERAAEGQARRAAQSAAPKSSKSSKSSKSKKGRKARGRPAGSRREQPPTNVSAYSQPKAPTGPPSLNRLVGDDQRRIAALQANQPAAAAAALRDVVADLDAMLVTTANYVRKVGTRRSRQSFQQAIPELVTVSELRALPFDEVAEILGLPTPVMDDLFDRLVRKGGFVRTDRDLMLREIRALRQQLQRASVTRDHGLLDRLMGFVLRIAQVIGLAAAAAPVGAVVVGEPAVAEAIMAGVTALVALAFQQVATYLSQQRAHDKHAATKAHADLLAELAKAGRLATPPAYEGEPAVLRFRLEVRCARARIASLPLAWPEKAQYWQELDDLLLALKHNEYETLDLVQRRLEILPPPP
ncbi:hypothetical protein ABZS29_34210 [Kribbella sp. NPDC005582]|uniref:hypothetical protein n=1 Tax=Kribbella sp. NPDC005582 TaxID=3156893 RepID=UPI0033B84A01